MSAGGRTAGSYIKREGRPSDHEILVSRLIDRPLRPMLAEGYFFELQLLASVFSYDGSHSMDTWAICGCAAALHCSTIPLSKAVAAVRVIICADGSIRINHKSVDDNECNTSAAGATSIHGTATSGDACRDISDDSRDVLSPLTGGQRAELVVAGTANALLMIEGEAAELEEDELLRAVQEAHEAIRAICDALDLLRDKVGKEKQKFVPVCPSDSMKSRAQELAERHGHDLDLALAGQVPGGKSARDEAIFAVRSSVLEQLVAEYESASGAANLQADANSNSGGGKLEGTSIDILASLAWKAALAARLRALIKRTNRRPDGRGLEEVRPIWIQPTVLPAAHGSALFTRGETQALAVATLGGEDMALRFEALSGDGARRFYLQYSFPPFSVGEVGRVGAPGRREIGHGKLAERALAPVMPPREDFPYVVRVESNILESNGSSSMASVCGASLALMDAGVPIKGPVAGIAMGLILGDSDAETSTGGIGGDENESLEAVVLSDILGLEDALGDMDFKVAGTASGVTSLQMDIKVEGITLNTMRRALDQARSGRLHILDQMARAVPAPRTELPHAVPKIRTMVIPVEKIGEVIGPGGKKIRAIVDKCGGEGVLSINIENDGTITFSSKDTQAINAAMALVKSLVVDIAAGDRFVGRVNKLLPFGAYIELMPGKEAWLHISEIAVERTEKVEDALKEGDELEVVVIDKGRKNQFRVSRKAVLLADSGSKSEDDGLVSEEILVEARRAAVTAAERRRKKNAVKTFGERDGGGDQPRRRTQPQQRESKEKS